jgi:hypothetical protein
MQEENQSGIAEKLTPESRQEPIGGYIQALQAPNRAFEPFHRTRHNQRAIFIFQ